MYAIIQTGGRQYKVKEGEEIRVEKLNAEEGSTFDFEDVLVLSKDGNTIFGTPTIENAKVKATIVEHAKAKKVIIFKYLAKKDMRKNKGHRQPYTLIKIESIEA